MDKLGKYEIHEKLGQGSFGTVYRAIDTTNGREVALKILHPESAQDRDLVQGALREAEQVQKLGAIPNVVAVYEAGAIDGKIVIASQFVKGKPLTEAIKEQRFSTVASILRVLDELAKALDYVHAAKVVHQDVKPANILIDDESGQLYLCDFGLARAARDSRGSFSASIRNSLGGTPNYMAPETPSSVTPKPAQDIFSLGVVAYELFTGRRPFPDSNFATFASSRAARVPKPSTLSPLVGPKVERELLRAIDLAPARRPKTAGAFVAALKTAAEVEVPNGAAQGRRKPVVGIAVASAAVLIPVLACAAAFAGIIPLPNGIGALIGRATPVVTVSVAQVTPLAQRSATIVAATPGPTSLSAAEIARTTTAQPPSSTPLAPSATPLPPTATLRPSATATPVPTVTPAPTATRTPAPTPGPGQQVALQGTGVDVQVPANTAGAASGKGRIVAQVKDGSGQPVKQALITLYSQKKDIAGNTIVDQGLNSNYTDSGGSVAFDLEPGEYTVGYEKRGYLWGTARGASGQGSIQVLSAKVTQVLFSLAKIEIGFLRADGTVVTQQYVGLFSQKKDLAGNWIRDEEIGGGYTESTGLYTFDIPPGYYFAEANLKGYSWGNAMNAKGEYNVPAQPGQVTRLIIKLGQLRVGLLDATGKPAANTYVVVYTLKNDVGGNPVEDAEVVSKYTDQTGIAQFDLTPGTYGIHVGQRVLKKVPIEAGRVTSSDGATVEVK